MKITILGTGTVGQTIAAKMVALKHEVYMGTRNADTTKAKPDVNGMTKKTFGQWHAENSQVHLINYTDVPADSELIINATSGLASIAALQKVGKEKLKNKTILDLANSLDFSKGMPPTLSVCNDNSLGEQIQNEFKDSNVVKSLNTMNCFLMMDPSIVPGDHTVFVSGNNADAKKAVIQLLESIGWKNKNIIDLGDITTARGTEMLLPIWLRLWGALGTPEFNFNIVKK